MKQCSKCKQSLPLDKFSKKAGTAYYQSWCKACTNEYVKSRYNPSDMLLHDSLVNKLHKYIALDPKDNAQYLITQIKCALMDSGYSASEACDIIDE